MTSFACVGLVMNALAVAFISRDKLMWPVSRGLHYTFLAMEELFLATVVAFIHLRHFVHQAGAQEMNYLEVGK